MPITEKQRKARANNMRKAAEVSRITRAIGKHFVAKGVTLEDLVDTSEDEEEKTFDPDQYISSSEEEEIPEPKPKKKKKKKIVLPSSSEEESESEEEAPKPKRKPKRKPKKITPPSSSEEEEEPPKRSALQSPRPQMTESTIIKRRPKIIM